MTSLWSPLSGSAVRLRPDPCLDKRRRLAVSSRFITVLPVIAAIVLLMSALGIVARVSPKSADDPVTGREQPIPPGAVCPAWEEGALANPSQRSRRRLL